MGEIRIIGGTNRGRRISVPKRGVRPTSDRVREAVFNVLGSVEGLHVLDLFAGSGALGLEALSRGAAHCTFVEEERSALTTLRANILRLDDEKRCTVVPLGYRKALKVGATRPTGYDLLFLDPPYRMLQVVDRDIGAVVESILRPGGLAVIEGPREAETCLGLEVVFHRVYGDTSVIMAKRSIDDL